jgi:hypothetical protein
LTRRTHLVERFGFEREAEPLEAHVVAGTCVAADADARNIAGCDIARIEQELSARRADARRVEHPFSFSRVAVGLEDRAQTSYRRIEARERIRHCENRSTLNLCAHAGPPEFLSVTLSQSLALFENRCRNRFARGRHHVNM